MRIPILLQRRNFYLNAPKEYAILEAIIVGGLLWNHHTSLPETVLSLLVIYEGYKSNSHFNYALLI